MKTMMEHALEYASLGWKVVPCHTPIFSGNTVACSCEDAECKNIGKHNHYDKKLLRNGAKNATTDPTLIERWWSMWPNANIGLVGVGVAIDIDPKNGGELISLDLAESEIDTPCAMTGSGGYHIFYAQPEGETLGNGRGNLPKGIDVRGAVGITIAAPSLHASGNRYQWIEGYEPMTTPLLPLPQKLLDLIKPKREERIVIKFPSLCRGGTARKGDATALEKYALKILEDEAVKVAETAEGGRNQELFKSAAKIGNILPWEVLEEEEVVESLYQAALQAGLTETETIRTIRSGLKKGKETPRELPVLNRRESDRNRIRPFEINIAA